jgi:hypothetical protein
MSRPALVRQQDLARLLRAAAAAGIAVTKIEVDLPTGKITISANGTAADSVETPEEKLLKAIHGRKTSLRHRQG